MAKTGSKVRSNTISLMYMEHEAAIKQFTHAMRRASVSYIADKTAHNGTPMTISMEAAFDRYIVACRRLRDHDPR